MTFASHMVRILWVLDMITYCPLWTPWSHSYSTKPGISSWLISVQTGSLALYCALEPTWTRTWLPWEIQLCDRAASWILKIFDGAASFMEKNALVLPLSCHFATAQVLWWSTSRLVPARPALSFSPGSCHPLPPFPVSIIIASLLTEMRK